MYVYIYICIYKYIYIHIYLPLSILYTYICRIVVSPPQIATCTNICLDSELIDFESFPKTTFQNMQIFIFIFIYIYIYIYISSYTCIFSINMSLFLYIHCRIGKAQCHGASYYIKPIVQLGQKTKGVCQSLYYSGFSKNARSGRLKKSNYRVTTHLLSPLALFKYTIEIS